MLSIFRSRLKVSLISLVLIFSFTEVSQAHEHHSYSHDWWRQTNNLRWMTALKDDLRLSALSIPGTHDTMALHGGAGNILRDFVVTQTMPLNLQLESGIRVLDIRCANIDGRFDIYHGDFFQHATFDDVLKMVVDFLGKNRRETVLMRVKEEHTNNPRQFAETFRGCWDRYIAHMWQGTSVDPTLREMRGKIVILQDFDRDNQKYGMPYNSFKIQDEFQLNGDEELYKSG